MDADLESLFERYRQHHDLEALAALFDRTAPELLKVALHLSPDPAAAEDLLQETFLTVLQKAWTFQEGRRLVPWLVTILVHRARNLHRTRRRALDRERLARTGPRLPEEEAEARELRARLDEALTEIDEPYREVLRLHLQQELAPAQVARLLGRPPSTVRTQLQRGLAALRRLLPAGLLPGVAPVHLRGLVGVREAVLARAGAGATGWSALLGGLVMGKRIVVAVAVVLVAGFALLFGGTWQGDPQLGEEGAHPVLAASDLQEIGSDPPPFQAGADPAARKPFADPCSLGSDVPHPSGAEWQVEVVQAGEEEEGPGPFPPVPFADVWSFLWEEMDDPWAQSESWAERSLPLEDSLLALGRRHRANAEGRLLVPRPRDARMKLIGCHEGYWGQLEIWPDEKPPFRLVLRPDPPLRVQVVDEHGRPRTGVPVSLAYRYAAENSGFMRTPPLQTAGPEGTVEFRRVRSLLRLWKPRMTWDDHLYVQLAIPANEPVVMALDPTDLPQEPVRLVLPPTGTVVVEVEGVERLPPRGAAHVRLTQNTFLCREDGSRWYRPQRCSNALIREKVVEFPYVGLGANIEIQVTFVMPGGARLREGDRKSGKGPTAAGEVVTFRFPEGRMSPFLSGQAVDEQGMPVAGRILDFTSIPPMLQKGTFTIGNGSRSTASRTDEEGRFILPLAPSTPPNYPGILRVTTHPRALGPALDGMVELPALSPGRNEIGKVVLRLPRPLVSGRLLDEGRKPIAQMPIEMTAESTIEIGNHGEYRKFYRVESTCWTDWEGRFSWGAPLDIKEIKLIGRNKGWSPVFKTVTVGSLDIELVLRRAGSLEGFFRLPKKATGDPIRLYLIYPDRPGGVDRFSLTCDIRGKILEREVPAGRASMMVGLSYMEQPFHRIDGIYIEPGTPTRDPRLQGFDLRPHLRLIEIRADDRKGRPVAEARINVEETEKNLPPLEGRDWHIGVDLIEGWCTILIPPSVTCLTIRGRGFKEYRLTEIKEINQIVLEWD